MTRRKSACINRTLVIVLVFLCQNVISRPQDDTASPILGSTPLSSSNKPTVNPIRKETTEKQETLVSVPEISSTSREVKDKPPAISDSIQKVTGQLVQKISNDTIENPIVIDTRIPPKVKNQLKHRIKTRNDDGDEPIENSHIGIAVPITMEELESENTVTEVVNESSTSNEGISTWILLSNPLNKDSSSSTTEPTKVEEQPKKQKPANSKNKAKRPQTNKVSKRPIIGSTNKSDLVAGGSAINENVYNKIKDTVLSNVQKNKNTGQRSTTTTTTNAAVTITEAPTTKKEVATKAPSTTTPPVKVTTKVAKKKNKQKVKVSTTAPVASESALLPMEAKEQEIEIEVSTPTTTTKKPKRSSTRKKTKTKKRKTSKPKPDKSTVTTELKTNNKTKSSKQPKPASTGPITTQIYNYFSREVMPSVGVGVIGLAGLVGIASYFLYPFTTPVRRTFEVDKKDDIYKNNAEEYGSESNGQAEEEMLGTVLAGMPAHTKHKINPYAAQTPHLNRYQVKKDQDIRYRHVQHTPSYDPHYKVQHYAQQKTGIAHGAVYPEPLNYNRPLYDTRHAYKPELKYDKGSTTYPQYPAVEPIYAAPQTGPTGISSYGNDNTNSVVYGVKPSAESDFKPVYPFDDQFYQQETTNHPVTYPPTSMFLGTNNEGEGNDEKYDDDSNVNSGVGDNKFVVGNVPKELSEESATPAIVPEHGPRNIRKRRNLRKKRGIAQSIEDILKAAKDNKDIFLSNEIDEIPIIPSKQEMYGMLSENKTESKPTENEIVLPVYGVSIHSDKDLLPTEIPTTTLKNNIVESISTIPLDDSKQELTTLETENSNELEVTTKSFKVFEVITNNPVNGDKSSPLITDGAPKAETTLINTINTETTTEFKLDTTSTMPPSPSPITEPKIPTSTSPNPDDGPEVITYPPLDQEFGIFSFLKRLVEFKYKLGLSILQTTSDSLNRYLRNMENTVKNVANASHH